MDGWWRRARTNNCWSAAPASAGWLVQIEKLFMYYVSYLLFEGGIDEKRSVKISNLRPQLESFGRKQIDASSAIIV